MDWVRLGVRYFLDPKIRGIDGDLADAAEVMFTRSVAWAGEVKRDGFIPEQDVELLTRRRRHEAVVSLLVELGLWVAVPGGYQVVRWPDWNGDNIDALARRRAVDRERQRRRRERLREHPPPASRDASRDVTVLEGEGELEGVLLEGEGYPPQPSTAGPPPVDNRNGKPREPPPWRCPAHTTTPADGPCGPCGDYRRARQDWDRQQAAAAQQRDRAATAGPRCNHCGNPTGSAYHRRVCPTRKDRP